METETRAKVRDCFAGSAQWFAILDAARGPRVRGWMARSGMETRSLYEGESAQEHDEWAPHLVKLNLNSAEFGELLAEGWGDSWGVFVQSNADFAEVRRHFRKFLKVRLPEGDLVYFRFYDPRVLRDFLPTFSAEELPAFCGPVRRFLMDGPEDSAPLGYEWDGRELKESRLAGER